MSRAPWTYKAEKVAWRGGFWCLVITITAYCLFPFYYTLLTSFEQGSDLFTVNYLPKSIDFTNYVSVLTTGSFVRSFFNSVLVSTLTVVVSLFLSITAAYSLGRINFRGSGTLMLAILSVSMFPQVAVLTGMFEAIRALGIFNTPMALIYSYMIFTIPFTVWVMTTFIRAIPKELEEAAIVDGAGSFLILRKIFMPLLWPSMVTTGLLAFIAAWNEFLFALTFLITNDQRTVNVAIALISGSTEHELPWGNLMAASVIVTLPLVILVMAFQHKIVAGLTAGAVKG